MNKANAQIKIQQPTLPGMCTPKKEIQSHNQYGIKYNTKPVLINLPRNTDPTSIS